MFPLYFELLQIITTLNQGNSSMYEYLWHVLNNSQFTTSILQIIIKDQWTMNSEQWNQNLSAPAFTVGNAANAPVQVQ